MTHFWRTVLVLGCLALVGAGTAGAQDRNRNPHGPMKEQCSTCHKAEAWTPVSLSRKFDHSKYGFALQGAHSSTPCKSCHQSLDFAGTTSTCAACHKDVHSGELGTDCSRCHSARNFLDRTEMVRMHQLTRFALNGSHAGLDCTACHAPAPQGRLVFVNHASTCVECHRQNYQLAKSPDHQGGGFPTDCNQCHSTTLWTAARFSHAGTRFPLTGAHRVASCGQCHLTPNYSATSTVCVSCHQRDYDNATVPDHKASQFPTDCTGCHTTASWTGGAFDHSVTAFPLTGGHKAAACQQCHGDGVYKGKSTLCVSCHQTDYNQTTSPNHVSAQFPTDCSACHTTIVWTTATFNHSATAFPLTGLHQTATCQQCHSDGVYKGKNMACVACHQTDYTTAANPNHQAAQFPPTCQDCHTTLTWLGATFDHDAQWFPVYSGQHRGKWSTCADCHTNPGNFTVFSCLTCHEHSQSQMDSKHQGNSGYRYNSQQCYSCHPDGRSG